MQNQYFFFSANSLFVMVNKPVCFVSSVQRFALGTHSIKKKTYLLFIISAIFSN
jgi:hypothetical protein